MEARLWARSAVAGLSSFSILLLCSFLSLSHAATVPSGLLVPRDQLANGTDLRVLPIGDSITWGAQSSDENGYRRTVHDQLVARGNSVDFVGAQANGNFDDDQHEGWRGKIIDEIRQLAGKGIYAGPNIVLLHAGTNDALHNVDMSNASSRLQGLVDYIFSVNADAAILLCKIIPSKTKDVQQRINILNSAIPALVASYLKAGRKVIMVEMDKALTVKDLKDDLHPNDAGYQKMAAAWLAAIDNADSKGWISKPGKSQAPPSATSVAS